MLGLKDFKFGEFKQQFAGLPVTEDDIYLRVTAGVNVDDGSAPEPLVQHLIVHFQLINGVDGEVTAGGTRRGRGDGS